LANFSGRAEQRSNSRLSNALADQGFKRATPDTSSLPAGSAEAAFTAHMLFPLLAKRSRRNAWSRPTLQQTEHLDQTDPLYSLAAVFEFKRTTGKNRRALASAWVTPWVQPDLCSELLAWFALRILPVCVCGRGSSQAACSRGTHLLPCCDIKKRNPVPTGGMPFAHSVGKDTRNTFETADQSSAPCLCYPSVNMPRRIACIALHIKTSRVDRCPALVGLSNARPLA